MVIVGYFLVCVLAELSAVIPDGWMDIIIHHVLHSEITGRSQNESRPS